MHKIEHKKMLRSEETFGKFLFLFFEFIIATTGIDTTLSVVITNHR